ncbi:MAG: MarR family winged helix-turn-helix transcriptional regulator [Paracoccaceae bacterium]|jgi:DNA-binding MarR family transcriptional regulator
MDKKTLQNLPGHQIRRLNQISTYLFSKHMQDAGYDITPVQYAALLAIKVMPNSDQVQIANYISYDKVTIGGVIERLQRKGFISRAVNERDKRARILNITNEGIHMISQVDAVIEQIQQDILKMLDEEEQQTFLRLLRKATQSPKEA